MFESIKKKLQRPQELPPNMVLIDARELADLRLKATSSERLMSKEHLTMKQLGTYIPNFEDLSKKPDGFKNAVGLMCAQLIGSAEWEYLITHLKQDQVNNSLFNPEVKYSDDFVRGTINGIYIVDDQVQTLGAGYNDRVQKGLVKAEA